MTQVCKVQWTLFPIIMLTSQCNEHPGKPQLIQMKVGFTRYTLFFLFWLKNIDCGYSLELSHRGSSKEHPQSMSEANTQIISWKMTILKPWKLALYYICMSSQWIVFSLKYFYVKLNLLSLIIIGLLSIFTGTLYRSEVITRPAE